MARLSKTKEQLEALSKSDLIDLILRSGQCAAPAAAAGSSAGTLQNATATQKQPDRMTPERLRTRIVASALVAAVAFLAVFALGTFYYPTPLPPPPPAIAPSSLDSSDHRRLAQKESLDLFKKSL